MRRLPQADGLSVAGRFGEWNFVCVHRGTDPIEASLLKGLLESEGIPARTTGEELVGAYAGVPRVCDVRVLVPDRYRSAAEALLADYDARRAGAGQWACPDCGETNEAAFELCWSCGVTRRTQAPG